MRRAPARLRSAVLMRVGSAVRATLHGRRSDIDGPMEGDVQWFAQTSNLHWTFNVGPCLLMWLHVTTRLAGHEL